MQNLNRKRRAIVELFERRQLFVAVPGGTIAAVTYTGPIEWSDTTTPYTLTGDVRMNNGFKLTIGAGVRVQSTSGKRVIIGEDGTFSEIEATGARFDTGVLVEGHGIATFNNTTFFAAPMFDIASSPLAQLSGNTFRAGLTINPNFAPELVESANTFATNTTVDVLGGRSITSSMTFPKPAGIVGYRIVYSGSGNGSVDNDVAITGTGTTVTITSGLTFGSDSVTERDLQIVGGALSANGVTFSTRLSSLSGGRFNLVNDVFQADAFFTAPGDASSSLAGNTFAGAARFDMDSTALPHLALSGNTFSTALAIQAEFAPKLVELTNTFAPNTTIDLIGGRAIDNSMTLPKPSGVVGYRIAYSGSGNGSVDNDLYITGAGTVVTIASGLIVSSDSVTERDLQVSGGALSANGVTFSTRVSGSNGGRFTLDGCTFQSDAAFSAPVGGASTLNNNTFAGSARFDMDSAALANFTLAGNTFSSLLAIHPEFAPKLVEAANTFATNTTVDLIGGRAIDNSITLPKPIGIVGYRIVYSGSGNGSVDNDLIVTGGGTTLTITSGLSIGSDSVTERDLQISGAKLDAVNVTFTTRVLGSNGGRFALSNSVFQSDAFFTAPLGTASSLNNNTFAGAARFDMDSAALPNFALSGNTFSTAIAIHPEFAPKLIEAANTFAPNTTVDLIGGRSVDNSLTLSKPAGIVGYRIVYSGSGNGSVDNDISVIGTSTTFTIAPGLVFGSDSVTERELQISPGGAGGKVIAKNVTFGSSVVTGPNASFIAEYSRFTRPITLSTGGIDLNIHRDDFSADLAGVIATGDANGSIDITQNWWGTTSAAGIEAKLTHHVDNVSLPTLITAPALTATPLDQTPPIMSGVFEYETRQAVHVIFSEDVSSSFAANKLVIKNLTTGATVTPSAASADGPTNTSFTLQFIGLLADGVYRVTLAPGASITDPSGNPLSIGTSFDFFVLAGDANRDRKVDFSDLVVVAQNYGQTGKTFSQGNFDYSADGKVDFNDLVILAQHYNVTLAAPAALRASVVPADKRKANVQLAELA